MRPVAVAVGTFDGVHLGHRRLLETAARLADDDGLELVVVTFDPHPRLVVRPERAPRLITGLDHRLELLGGVPGVARVEVLAFDRARSEQAPESFLADTLVGGLEAGLLVVGGNFRFGRGGAGDVSMAKRLGARLGLRVVAMTLVEGARGVVISSSEIRRLVADGHLGHAGALLGWPYELRGTFHPAAPAATDGGLGRGGSLGEVRVAPELLLPPPGRYLVRAGPLGAAAAAAAIAFVPPTGGAIVLETPHGCRPPASWQPGGPLRITFVTDMAHGGLRGARSGSRHGGDR